MLLAVLPLFGLECCSLTLLDCLKMALLAKTLPFKQPQRKKSRTVESGDRGSRQKLKFLEVIRFSNFVFIH